MLKPVTILALDDVAAPLAHAVQQRIAATLGLDDLVQARAVAGPAELAQTIHSVYAHRQRPDSPLRLRDDISTRELVLVMLSAAGPARATLLETTRQIREIYTTRRFASLVAVEILCLLPEVAGTTQPEDYAAAYALLKMLNAEETKPFDEVWLLDATNASRVHLGALAQSLDAYAEAVAGALTYEPEMSGALPGIHPRGMHPTFSTFGYASLVFPRDAALQRIEPRFARELVETKLLGGEAPPHAQLAAKQFVAAEGFAVPLSRIGVDAGQSLFRRFQPKTQVGERTRSAEELIAAVRGELQAFRDSTHLANLDALAKQGDQTIREHAALLERTVDETLDRDGYETAAKLLDALVDPLPDLRADAELAPRNLVTELRAATAALDARLHFTPNLAASEAARKRVREQETAIQDRKLVADIVSAEERENEKARNAAQEEETARLAAETEAKEQELRELFAQLPRVEQALREALDARRVWLWRQIFIVTAGVTALYAIPYAFGVLRPNFERITSVAVWGALLFVMVTGLRYLTQIVPAVRQARDHLARVRVQIETTDHAKNAAHNAELQFEYDRTHHRTALRALRAIRHSVNAMLDAVRARRQELEELAASFVCASIVSRGVSLSIVDNAEVDGWYERTVDDRKPFVREFPIRRSASRHLGMDELRQRITAYASTAFAGFRKFTIATAASEVASEPKLTQRLKRFVDMSAPLVEVRDDDLPAQKAIQRDCTLWVDANDAMWTSQLQRRFPDAHVKPAPDGLCVHALTRVLHYPGYVLGQIEYYRAQYEAAATPEHAHVADLLPLDFIVGAPVRAAYEQILLARALGVVIVGHDGQLTMSDSLLGTSNLIAAQTLASPESAPFRDQLDAALLPRLEVTRDVTRELRSLQQSTPLTPLDRNVLDGLLKKYATLV